jgi:hypothetical protein
MSLIRAQAVIKRRSLIPRDNITNTWHLNAGNESTTDDLVEVGARLATFYQAISGYLHPVISDAALIHEIKVTRRAATSAFGNVTEPSGVIPPSGPADHVKTFTMSGSGTGLLPAEVAAVLTLEAGSTTFSEEVGATRPAARHRGRIFIGPLGNSAMIQDGTTLEVHLDPTFRTQIFNAFQALSNGLTALANPIQIGVYSPALFQVNGVTHVSMDNAPDIIRSRGVRATNRVRQTVGAAVLAA